MRLAPFDLINYFWGGSLRVFPSLVIVFIPIRFDLSLSVRRDHGFSFPSPPPETSRLRWFKPVSPFSNVARSLEGLVFGPVFHVRRFLLPSNPLPASAAPVPSPY